MRSTNSKFKFGINDDVRITKYKTTFAKGYKPGWTNNLNTKPPRYLVRGSNDVILKGVFYAPELTKIITKKYSQCKEIILKSLMLG